MMNQKSYHSPEIEVILLDREDIVTASGPEEWYPGQGENEGIII